MDLRKLKTILLLLCIACLSQGCKTYYGNGIAGGTYTYMHTPMSKKNTTICKNYISARYNKDLTYYAKEDNKFGELSYHHAVSKSYINYAIGGGFFMGQYKVANLKDELADLNKNYLYYGGVVRGKVAFNWPISPNFHWRVIGIQGSWLIERGPFRNFKKDLVDLGNSEAGLFFKNATSTTKDLSNFSFYPYTEFSCKIGPSFIITPNIGLGYKINGIADFRTFMGLNVSYQEKVNLWIVMQEVSDGIDSQINNDFISECQGNNSNIQIGISVAF